MVRSQEEVSEEAEPEDFLSNEAESVLSGEDISEHSRGLTKAEVQTLYDNLGEDLEEQVLEAGSEYLAELGVDVDPEEVDLTVVTSREDISHIDEDLRTDENAVYMHDSEEVFIFTEWKGMTPSKSDPVGSTAHELKHRDQEINLDEGRKPNYPVTEAVTQLLNLYRRGVIDNKYRREEIVEGIEDSSYPNPEDLADETRLAASCYDKLSEQVGSKEAIEFMLNKYEQRRAKALQD